VINGKSYYKLVYQEDIYSDSDIYLRFDAADSTFKAYDRSSSGWYENGELFYFKKGVKQGDVWKQESMGQFPYFYHNVEDVRRTSIFGKEVLSFYIISTDSGLLGGGEWWTEEFGLMKYNNEGSNNYLMGCVIDGIAYGDTTSVGVNKDENLVPSEYELSQNYPNPFNPVTMINYSLPELSNVELKVYDILGNEITTLVKKEQYPGKYAVSFDGNGLSSGLYIYMLKAGKIRMVKKMLLLK
ncbi:MAG: T9SS type A sorting domain-containing protein, partial [Bacteroidota bacterium]